jgi:hypothetical protein
MPFFDQAATDQLSAAFDALAFDSVEISLDVFVTNMLGLNVSQLSLYFPDLGAPAEDERYIFMDRLAGILDARRQKILRGEGRLSSAVLSKRVDVLTNGYTYSVMGLGHYLTQNGEADQFVGRMAHHNSVREFLTGIGDGHKLEALAASVLRKIYKNCTLTQRSFDQGVDCFAGQEVLELSSWCCDPDMLFLLRKVGERLHIIASCKANEGNVAGGNPSTISPAHVRELIGAWMIQRSDSGMWQQQARIKILSPLQLLLVTTYRLSDNSQSLCRRMGVAVWGIPELVYLISRHAPDSVFPPANNFTFSPNELDQWLESVQPEAIVG